jgi:hypothetical protein
VPGVEGLGVCAVGAAALSDLGWTALAFEVVMAVDGLGDLLVLRHSPCEGERDMPYPSRYGLKGQCVNADEHWTRRKREREVRLSAFEICMVENIQSLLVKPRAARLL